MNEYFLICLPPIQLFDVSNLRATIFSCTEIEAKNFGHFLSETLAILFEIRSNEEKFKAECLSVPGFQKKWPTTEETAGEYLTYREFQQVLYKWHNKLFKVRGEKRVGGGEGLKSESVWVCLK